MTFTKADTNKVKGIAVLLLIFHHMYRTQERIDFLQAKALFLSDERVSQLAHCVRICVPIFVFLTAYGLATIMKRDAEMKIRYIVTRLWKLLAPYWVTLVLIWGFYFIIPGISTQGTYGGNFIYPLLDFIPLLDILGLSNHMLMGIFWYMNFAIIEIVILPYIFLLEKKTGGLLVVATCLLYPLIPNYFTSPCGGMYNQYLLAIELGVLFAIYDGFEKIDEIIKRCSIILKATIAIGLLVVSIVAPYIAWFKVTTTVYVYKSFLHTVGALAMVLFIFLFVRWKWLCAVFSTIGKYSADVFLTHILVFTQLQPILSKIRVLELQYIIAACLCVIVGFLIGCIKKYTKYNDFVNWVARKIQGTHWRITEGN